MLSTTQAFQDRRDSRPTLCTSVYTSSPVRLSDPVVNGAAQRIQRHRSDTHSLLPSVKCGSWSLSLISVVWIVASNSGRLSAWLISFESSCIVLSAWCWLPSRMIVAFFLVTASHLPVALPQRPFPRQLPVKWLACTLAYPHI